MMGPVQVLVVGFDDPTFSGDVLAEFARLREAGIVRLVDVLLVAHAQDGTLETLPPPPGVDPDLGRVAAALFGEAADGRGARAGGPDTASHDAPAWSLADAVPPGSIAAVALIEHLWAAGLTAAIRRAGGRPLEETWLAPDDVEVLEAITARVGT